LPQGRRRDGRHWQQRWRAGRGDCGQFGGGCPTAHLLDDNQLIVYEEATLTHHGLARL
jgi:hypothetical protein